MKRFFFFLLLLTSIVANAQDFITRGKIEFEIKRNNKKIYSETDRANNPYLASLPEFDISYRDLLFSWNQSVYQPARKGSTPSRYINENSVYSDLDNQRVVKKIQNMGEYYVYEDSVKKIKWKIENETRKIAGWECRKAIGRIYDSVYVVAFYCPEIVPQGGPEMFSGLPGMILGLAIPRYYTTWFATKIELASIDESKIGPPVVKKSKTYSKRELAEIYFKRYKDAGWWKDITIEKVMSMLDSYTF
ncbi:MAG TPA: GLPGLI family protein [Chitinophagaceae bacterium]